MDILHSIALYCLLAVNAVAFVAYGVDKWEGPQGPLAHPREHPPRPCRDRRQHRCMGWHEGVASQDPAPGSSGMAYPPYLRCNSSLYRICTSAAREVLSHVTGVWPKRRSVSDGNSQCPAHFCVYSPVSVVCRPRPSDQHPVAAFLCRTAFGVLELLELGQQLHALFLRRGRIFDVGQDGLYLLAHDG